MKKIRMLYGAVVLVLTALLVLGGIWIPEALLKSKAHSLSEGKTEVVDKQEVTPYSFATGGDTRISKLSELVDTYYADSEDEGSGIRESREPLDTELSALQAEEKGQEFLNSLERAWKTWGVDPLGMFDSTDAGEVMTDAAADTGMAALGQTGEPLFLTVETDQETAAWICTYDLGEQTVTLALDAVTGIVVCIRYTTFDTPIEEQYIQAEAVGSAYEGMYGDDYTFGEAVMTEKVKNTQSQKWEVSYISTGKTLQLVYQMSYLSGKKGDTFTSLVNIRLQTIEN